ncbi:hypothetical protein [Amycolatopsis sp. lyj-112]|uniref:hypothetical protein n=1 Tax=Amycolatopsis sp. lyj-112 TaxID=2789288 RepID=UPI003979E462
MTATASTESVAGEDGAFRTVIQVPHPHRLVVAGGDCDRPTVNLSHRHRIH